ncbi:hypothetical protein B0H10DRAFT_2215708 [Mycena sp. CBHHK59/15]|nr:hypothetical protein B0H10DRAFT_2215708 [Mycena sp. CBHHK59/15]
MSTLGLHCLSRISALGKRPVLTRTQIPHRKRISRSPPCTLTPAQLSFIQNLPKAELRAHLNGSIPVALFLDMAREYRATSPSTDGLAVQAGLRRLENLAPTELRDFFGLFPAIYAMTSTPAALARAAPQCAYLELRSTPRATASMTSAEYVETVLAEVERYPRDKAALIVSVNRNMAEHVVEECITIARAFKADGRRVVGVDLCGDPFVGDIQKFAKHFVAGKEDEECKTVGSLDQHHIRYYLSQGHAFAICTDDALPFQTSLPAEYALLLAQPPLGLGHAKHEVSKIARMSMEHRMYTA